MLRIQRAVSITLIALGLILYGGVEEGAYAYGKRSLSIQTERVKGLINDLNLLRRELNTMYETMSRDDAAGFNVVLDMVDETLDDLLALQSMIFLASASISQAQTDRVVRLWLDDVHSEMQVNLHVLEKMSAVSYGYHVHFAVENTQALFKELIPHLEKMKSYFH